MKYLKNPNNLKEIVKGEVFGEAFDSWPELTQDEITIYELKKAKKEKFKDLTKAYYANAEKFIMSVTFNGRTEYVESLNKSTGLVGLKQALAKIENDVALSTVADQILPLKYRGIQRMYYIYVSEFSRNNAIDVIIMKQSKRQELITFFQNAITQYTSEYEYNLESVKYAQDYCNYFQETLLNESTKFGYRQYKEQLDALTTIEEVQAFTCDFTPLTLTLPEECIEDVQYNYYD